MATATQVIRTSDVVIKQRFPLAKGKAHKKTPSDGRKDLDATNKLGRFFLGRVNVKMLSY